MYRASCVLISCYSHIHYTKQKWKWNTWWVIAVDSMFTRSFIGENEHVLTSEILHKETLPAFFRPPRTNDFIDVALFCLFLSRTLLGNKKIFLNRVLKTFRCEESETMESCLGVIGCQWCTTDEDGSSPLQSAYCSPIDQCYSGIKGRRIRSMTKSVLASFPRWNCRWQAKFWLINVAFQPVLDATVTLVRLV